MSIASSQLVPNVGSEAGPTTQTDSRADRYKTQFVTYCEAIQLLRPYAVNKSDCRGAIYDTFDVDYWIAMRLFSGGAARARRICRASPRYDAVGCHDYC